jgi:hypothetical protein
MLRQTASGSLKPRAITASMNFLLMQQFFVDKKSQTALEMGCKFLKLHFVGKNRTLTFSDAMVPRRNKGTQFSFADESSREPFSKGIP